MGEIIALGTNRLIKIQWDRPDYPCVFSPKLTIKKENTYVLIFSRHQEKEYNAIMSVPGIKIIFQSKPAVNTVHPAQPRNFVCVVEFENDYPAVP